MTGAPASGRCACAPAGARAPSCVHPGRRPRNGWCRCAHEPVGGSTAARERHLVRILECAAQRDHLRWGEPFRVVTWGEPFRVVTAEPGRRVRTTQHVATAQDVASGRLVRAATALGSYIGRRRSRGGVSPSGETVTRPRSRRRPEHLHARGGVSPSGETVARPSD